MKFRDEVLMARRRCRGWLESRHVVAVVRARARAVDETGFIVPPPPGGGGLYGEKSQSANFANIDREGGGRRRRRRRRRKQRRKKEKGS